MDPQITKKQFRAALGLTTDAEVAAFFGISAGAVCQWPEDGAMPPLRCMQAVAKRPDLWPIAANDSEAA